MEGQTKLSFEARILLIICIIGVIRMIYSVYINYSMELSWIKWVNGFALLGFLMVVIYLIYKQVRMNNITVTVSIVTLILLSVSWINNGGLEGHSEYNMISLIIALALINKGRFLWMVSTMVVVVQVLLVITWDPNSPIIEFLNVNKEPRIIDYQIAVIMITFGLIYLGLQFNKESITIAKQKVKLTVTLKTLEYENGKLDA